MLFQGCALMIWSQGFGSWTTNCPSLCCPKWTLGGGWCRIRFWKWSPKNRTVWNRFDFHKISDEFYMIHHDPGVFFLFFPYGGGVIIPKILDFEAADGLMAKPSQVVQTLLEAQADLDAQWLATWRIKMSHPCSDVDDS